MHCPYYGTAAARAAFTGSVPVPIPAASHGPVNPGLGRRSCAVCAQQRQHAKLIPGKGAASTDATSSRRSGASPASATSAVKSRDNHNNTLTLIPGPSMARLHSCQKSHLDQFPLYPNLVHPLGMASSMLSATLRALIQKHAGRFIKARLSPTRAFPLPEHKSLLRIFGPRIW